MRAPSSFKKEFLKKWVLGLQMCSSFSKEMNFSERKKVIKLSADVAMASARDGKTYWSRAIIVDASKQSHDNIIVKNILGSKFERLTKTSIRCVMCNKRIRSKKILRRSCTIRRTRKTAPWRIQACSIGKYLVKRRTQALKGLIPGGESMDEFSLLEETLDYMFTLQAQVDVMTCLANALEQSNCK